MAKKNEARILELVKGCINSLHKTDAGFILPIGYNPLEKIRGALFHWVAVPFNGHDVFCELRCPNATQLEQCGDISNITIGHENEKPLYEDIIKIRNYQEALCRLVLNRPTYDHIAEAVGENDFAISEKKKELEAIKKRFADNAGILNEAQKKTLDAQIKTIELQIGFILPDDAMAFLTKWAMGNDVSDVKKLTKESLLKAASLAKAHNKAPADYISGVFTDYNKAEIDAYAFAVLHEFLKEQEAVQGAKHEWKRFGSLRGGK